MADDLEAARAEWVGREFDRIDLHVEEQAMLDWADSVGETDAKYTDPSHEDFQAHPTFTAHFASPRLFPDEFPQLGGKGGIDGGKSVEIHAPVRSGDTLTAVSSIADIYDKTGRSGTMIFVVHRMVYSNQHGEKVSTVDWRSIRPGGDK